jgi:predicted hydrolase (HD superfamily)
MEDDPRVTAAEDLAATPSETAALEALREATGQSGGPMERHGLRVFLIADRLATARELQVDREVLLIAGLLHDVGLYDAASHGGVYVREGAEFTAEILRKHAWDEERIRLCFDAIERHHELRSQWDRGEEVELIRRADLVDVSSGLVRFGLSREWLRDLGKSVSRDGTYRTIGYEVARVLRHRPLTFPQIFRR